MSNTPDKITVSQYAKIRGVSAQSVYKRLTTSLQPFLIVDNGKKYISVLALSIPEKENLSTVDNDLKQPLPTVDNPPENAFLMEQIHEKDEQIKSLFKQIDEERERSRELMRLLENSQQQLQNSQYLLLQAQNNNLPTPKEEEGEQTEEQPKAEKKNIFSMIFHRKK